jgi:hypothetical protein
MGVEYEDYITAKPEGFRLIGENRMRKAKEHKELLAALAKRNMTVKEIHALYKLTDGKYSKTLKTVYRHLDALEEIDLIMVAGHRKYKGARSLEKLYTRTAKVFSDDSSKKKEWLQTEDGKKFLDALTEAIWLTGKGNGDKEELRSMVEQMFGELQDHTIDMVRRMSSDERYEELVENTSFDHIKAILEMGPPIFTMMGNPELVEKMRELLG